MFGGDCKCSFKNWLATSFVIAVLFLGMDMFFHGFCMKKLYAENMQLFRPMDQWIALRWWAYLGYLAFGALFTCIYGKGYDPSRGKAGQGIRYGILLGLLYWGANLLISAPYLLFPKRFFIDWFAIGMAEFVVLGFIVGMLYKPKTA